MSKKRKANQPFIRFAFLVYVALMLWLLFGRFRGLDEGVSYEEALLQNVNFIPFFTIKNYLQVVLRHTNQYAYTHCFINLVGNVVLFVPAGWLIPAIWKNQRNFLQFTATCLSCITIIELTQLLSLLGSFDVDDVILNMSGLWFGYLCYILTHLKRL